MGSMNPSFEGLPSKILCASYKAYYVHYAHTGATHFNFNSSNNARELDTRMVHGNHRGNEQSERAN